MFDRFTNPAAPAANGFIAIGFGTDNNAASTLESTGPGVAAASAINDTTFSVLFQQAANGNLANGQTNLGTTGINPGQNNFNYGDTTTAPLDRHTASIILTPATAGNFTSGTINYEIIVDGTSRFTGSFAADGTDLSIVSFSSNQSAQRYIDDFVVTAIPVPEPGSILAVVAVGGLLGRRLVRRR